MKRLVWTMFAVLTLLALDACNTNDAPKKKSTPKANPPKVKAN